MKVNYVDDRGEKHMFLIDDSQVAGIDFHTNDEDGKKVKFLLASGETLTLYLGFVNNEPWEQLRDYFRERLI